MTGSANHRKGYAAEYLVQCYLAELQPGVYRPRAGARDDVGDIVGLPIVVSVKNHKAIDLAGWVKGLKRMVVAAEQVTGVVWHKAIGKGHPRDWYVTMTGEMFLPFLRAYMEVNDGVAMSGDQVQQPGSGVRPVRRLSQLHADPPARDPGPVASSPVDARRQRRRRPARESNNE